MVAAVGRDDVAWADVPVVSSETGGGRVWSATPALYPDWFDMPEGHCEAFKVIYECNYAQSIEGAIDSAHAGSGTASANAAMRVNESMVRRWWRKSR